ncbi:MAG: sigma-70 family RNA polymerase sigma factor, partial [Isosphaeraceae bacterium]
MTGGAMTTGLKHLGDLFGGGTAIGLGDGEFLRRYAAARDGSAFAALLARHGPMVAATCRAVLRDPLDAEDAFQATFLVLARRAGSIRAGDALAGWLHRVARRAAVQRSLEIRRRRRIESEALAMDVPDDRSRPGLDPDELAILHEEVDRLPDRERLPVVLCDVEGQTYEQAAGRLGWTVPALYHRLAAGRKRLRARLMRRGITAAAAGGLFESSRNLAHAAPVPAAWTASALATATGGPVPASAAGLAHTLLRSLLMTRLTVVALGFLATAALVASGISAALAGRPDPPKVPRVADGPSTDGADPARRVTLVVSAGELTNGAGMAGVRVTLRTWNPDKRTTASTDASGIARFQVAADCRYLVLHAEREGFVPAMIRWEPRDGAEPIPQQFRFSMEKATTIRGRVVDEKDRPLAGATVIIDVDRAYPGSPQKPDLNFRSTLTDADGRWSFSCVPAKPDSIKVTAYHYLCLTEYAWFVPEEFQPASALRDGSATLRLDRGTLVQGTVVGPDGQPIPDAEIVIGDNSRVGNLIPPIKADAQGRFKLGFKPGIATTLFARHAGFGPAMERLRITSEPQRFTIRLPAPRKMSVRVVNRDGKPLPGAAVSVRSWHGSESLDADFQPEGDGRFTWNDAPPDEVRIAVNADGHRGASNITIQPGRSIEVVLGLDRKTKIQGTVTDAHTGRPIPRFTLTRGSVWKGRHLPAWYPVDAEAVKGPGRFAFETGDELGDGNWLRAEAEGYLPEDFALAKADGKPQTHAFRLVPAGPIRGTLQKPDGSPAEGAFVYLEIGEGQCRLDNGDFYRGEKRLRATTDVDGHFALPPQKDDYLLVAVADAGYATVPRRDVREGGAIRLQPWARIEGTYRIGGIPVPGVELYSFDDDYPPYDGQLHVQDFVLAKTDASGHFVMPRVLPGRRVIRLRVPNNFDRRYWP